MAKINMTYKVRQRARFPLNLTDCNQVIPIRALVLREDNNGAQFTHCVIHRYTSAGGVDVPQTDAVFTSQGLVETDRVFGRTVKRHPVWRQFAVYYVTPEGTQGVGERATEVLVFKVGATSLKHLVNIRTDDRTLALAAART